MARIGFSRPEGRVTIDYPDAMSLDDLEETIGVHISVCRLAMDAPHDPPKTGRTKAPLLDPMPREDVNLPPGIDE